MKAIGLIAAFAVIGAANANIIITQWDFNGPSTGEVPGGPNSPTPTIGSGTASLLGVNGSFVSGIVDGGSSDPVITSPPNYAWNTSGYAPQGTENGERGIQFAVDTTGFSEIIVKYDNRNSNTGTRWTRFDYTADGTNWILGSAASNTVFENSAGNTWFNVRTIDLSSVAAVDNNANFAFRMVSIFGPQTGPFDDNETYTQYWAANSGSNYGTAGTVRFDMVTIEAVPEPATMLALGAGLAGLLARRRAKKA